MHGASDAVCCSVLQHVAVARHEFIICGGRANAWCLRCSVLQCVGTCCSVLQRVAVDEHKEGKANVLCVRTHTHMYTHTFCSDSAAVCCSVLQCVAADVHEHRIGHIRTHIQG